MPQATLVPVNPAVVKWAIDQSGLTVEAIARRANVPPEVVASWISGTGSPSKTQFALLAQAVKRPTSVFFLPAAPKVQTRSVRFRAPIGSRRTQLNPDERDSIASAARLQRLFAWLAERTRTRADLSRFKGPEDPDGAAGHVRDLIKITPAQQRKWRDARAAWAVRVATGAGKGWDQGVRPTGRLGVTHRSQLRVLSSSPNLLPFPRVRSPSARRGLGVLRI